MKRTPSPWKIRKRVGMFVTNTLVVSEDGSVLANLHCEAEGNGLLIIAAPDLLDACGMLKEAWEKAAEDQQVDWDSLNQATEKAIEAYNKATGFIVEEESDG